MSTEHQQYSIANQAAAIALYAAAHGFGIVRSYVDAGRSGTTIKRRDALQELLLTVAAGRADFSLILVYDVSRWGRFIDIDEAAHYEFLCKRAGLEVHYCAEQFANDNSPASTLLKALKRMMAGEFSRELGVKVSEGQNRIVSLGFRVGGAAPYGYERMVLGTNGEWKQVLLRGEHKSAQTDRVTLIPGPEEERSTVREIFRLYTEENQRPTRIANNLNRMGLTRRGSPWLPGMVRSILRNPLYVGHYVWSASKFASSDFRARCPESRIARKNAFKGIISDAVFARAQEMTKAAVAKRSSLEMLDALRQLWKREGHLSTDVIRNARRTDIPTAVSYRRRFGSLTRAYNLIGYVPRYQFSQAPPDRLQQLKTNLWNGLAHRLSEVGASFKLIRVTSRKAVVLLNGLMKTQFIFIHPRRTPRGANVWPLWHMAFRSLDLVIIVRLDTSHAKVLDFYLLPRVTRIRGRLMLGATRNPAFIDCYRVNDLTALINAVSRSAIPQQI